MYNNDSFCRSAWKSFGGSGFALMNEQWNLPIRRAAINLFAHDYYRNQKTVAS